MKTSHAYIIAAGLVLAALVFGLFFYGARSGQDSVSVVGAATQRFESDIVKWRITLGATVGLDALGQGYRDIDQALTNLKATLSGEQLGDDEISVQPVNFYQNYDREGTPSGYNLNQIVTVISANVDRVESLALNPTTLADRGIFMQNSSLEYFNSDIDSIKVDLLAAATQDARKRAERIADNGGVSLGKVSSLQAGVFQIREPYSTDVSAYGIYNTGSKDKDITVTVRATFLLD